VYAWSRPCAIGKECPVGEDPKTCPAAQTNNAAYDCPESVSPHPVRRGYITHFRANGVPTADVISDRCDADPETIERARTIEITDVRENVASADVAERVSYHE